MTKRRVFHAVVLSVLLSSVLIAQDETPTKVNNQNRTGDLPFSTKIGTDLESVDLATGFLTVKLPIASVPGRGQDFQFGLRYSSNYFVTGVRVDAQTQIPYQVWNVESRNYITTAGVGWETPKSAVTMATTKTFCYQTNGSTIQRVLYMYHDANGVGHPLALRFSSDDLCGRTDPQGPDLDGAGIWATGVVGGYPIIAVTLADGSAATMNARSAPIYGTSWKDANGNSQTEEGTDTLGRTIVTQQNGTNQILYKVYDSNGIQQTYTANLTNINLLTNFHLNGFYGTLIREGGGTRSVIQSFILPNNKSYQFQYESGNYGAITRVDLPTGGYITYTWATFADSDHTYRYVASRTVHVDGQSYTWNFSRTGPRNSTTVTVTDPLGNQSQYVAGYGAIFSAKMYSGAVGGTPLRQYVMTYQSDGDPLYNDRAPFYESPMVALRLTSITTTLDTGQVSQKQFDYDTFNYPFHECGFDDFGGCPTDPDTQTTSHGNVTEIREYDYGTVPAVWGQGTPGPLMRRTDKTYLNYIVNKVLQETTFDANNVQQAQIQFEYDNYVAGVNPLQGTSGVAQHDYTNYSSGFVYRGNATRIKRWRNTDGALLTTTYTYDDLGNIRAISDPLNHTTSYSYDDRWSGTSCLPPTGYTGQAYATQMTNALGKRLQMTYFPCTARVQARKDENDILAGRAGVTYLYDLLGRVTQKNLTDGGQITTSYNDSPPVSATTNTKITGTLTMTSVAIRDGLGRPRKTQLASDPEGVTYTRLVYDALGRKSQDWNPTRCDPDVYPTSCAGETTYGITTYNYDPLGRVTKVIPPDGTSAANNVTTSYTGNTSTVTDQAGRARKNQTDAQGRLTTVWEDPVGLNYETDYQYDVLDNLIRVDQKGGDPNSANWRTRTFSYNSLGQLLQAVNPESGTISYAYDNGGNLQTKTSPAPNQTNPNVTQAISYCYDQVNRPTAKGYGMQICTNGTLPSPVAAYFYDQTSYNGVNVANGVGKRTGMSDASGVTVWSYPITAGVGWMTTEVRTINGVRNTITTQDNLDGSLATLTYPSGRAITYTPSGAGRMLSAVDTVNSINYVTGAKYAPPGGLSQFSNSSSISAALTYNSRLQPLQLYFTTGTITTTTLSQLQQNACPTTTAAIMSRSYSFGLGTNDNGNVQTIVNCPDTNRTQNFTYDALNRIQTAYSSGPNWGESFGSQTTPGVPPSTSGIDAWGNLWQRSPITGKIYYEPLNAPAIPNNQLTGFGYDAAGNMTANGSATYIYDAENRLASTGGVTYTYDGDGVRVMKAGGTLYWGPGPLAESDLTASSASWKEYVFFDGQRVARRDASDSSVHYFFTDHLHSTSVITNASGATLEQDVDYYPYGGIAGGSASDHYLFNGKERDGESGLDYFGARHYASNLSRFLTADWAAKPTAVPYANYGNPQSLNLYSYVQNNPATLGDPDGHQLIRETKEGLQGHDEWSGTAYLNWAFLLPDAVVDAELNAQAIGEATAHQKTQPAQNPFNPTVTYDKNLSAKDLAADQSKVGAAIGVINANWSKLSDQEKATVGNIKSIDVSGSAQRSYVQESTGKLTLTQDYVSKSSKAWLASSIGHDGEHVALFNSGGIGASRGLPAEVKAMQFQLQVGTKFGLSATETKYLQGLIQNPSQLQQYINTPP